MSKIVNAKRKDSTNIIIYKLSVKTQDYDKSKYKFQVQVKSKATEKTAL